MAQTGYDVTIAGTTDGGDRVPDLSPREAFERWSGRIQAEKKESTISSYDYRVEDFVEWCESEGVVKVSELNGWDLDSYQIHRQKQDLEKITLNKQLGTVREFLRYCARIELVDEALPEKIEPPEVSKQGDVDETRLEPDRAEALFDYYNEHDYGSRDHALLTVFWYTGARLTAVRGLNLDHYHSEEQFLEFIHEPERGFPVKNGIDGERAVGLTDYAADVLNEYIGSNRVTQFDERGKEPLFTTTVGRIGENTVRARMYQSTVPCLYVDCPHGKARKTCDWTDYSHASKCPSSRAPHQIRTGTITWQLNKGVPIEVVADRVNTSVRVLKKHYDQPTRREELEKRRRGEVHKLSFDDGGDGE